MFPPEAEMTEERWKAIEKADRAHRNMNCETERDIRCHFPVSRKTHSDGWRGEWFRIRSTD